MNAHERYEALKEFDKFLKESAKTEKQLISNYDYISWLETFTQAYPNFATDFWVYKMDKLSPEDSKKIDLLIPFFSAIYSYCYKYLIAHINPESPETKQVSLKHNNVGYELKVVMKHGVYVYVMREEPQDNAIDFCDIVNNIPPKDFEAKKELLAKFEEVVSAMKDTHIPRDAMMDIVSKYY